ncbi:MAG: hypothetical protein V3V00_14000 [Saprospiraceae bacterium]
MNILIDWLSKRKVLNVALIIIYFIAVVLPHKMFGTFINKFFLKGGMTRHEYNYNVALVSAIILALIVIVLSIQLKNNLHWKKIILYLLSSTAFAVIIIKYLFVINIEMVHFPQYACFAILVYPLVKRYQSALIWTTIAGAIDEAYQYFYLVPNDTGYYDFNDVVTNLIGASFGLIILKSFNIKNIKAPQFFKRSEVKGIIGITIVIGLLFLFGVMGVHAGHGASYPIIKKQITTFWSTVPPQVTYHVVRPWEGLLYTAMMWLYYWKLGRE